MNTAFYEVFKGKLKKQKESLKRELERAKSDRRKEWLKKQIKEAKEMRNILREMEKKLGVQTHCPHCKKEL